MNSILLISGSDSSGGAGLQADLRAVSAHPTLLHAYSAITAVTAQGQKGVMHIQPTPAAALKSQLEAALSFGPPDAIKIGMVCNREQIDLLAEFLRGQSCPIVVDPVLRSTSNRPLLDADAIVHYATYLLPHATLITPNADEWDTLEPKWKKLKKHCPILRKGGHDTGDTLTDTLHLPDGAHMDFYHPRQAYTPRGTGCWLATSIACRLAKGQTIAQACQASIAQLQSHIIHASCIEDMWYL